MANFNYKTLMATVVGAGFAAALAASPAQAQDCSGPGCGGPIDGIPGDPTVPDPVDPGTPTNPGTVINVGPIEGGQGGQGGQGGAGGNGYGGQGGQGGQGFGGEGGSATGGSVDNSGNNVGGQGGSSTGNTTTNNIQTGGYSSTYNQVRQAPGMATMVGPNSFGGITCINGGGGVQATASFAGFGGGAGYQNGVETSNECVATVTEAAKETRTCEAGLTSPDDAIRASAAEQCLGAGVETVRRRVVSGDANTNNGTMGLLFGAQAAPEPQPYYSAPAEAVTYEPYQESGRVQAPVLNADGTQ